MFKKNFAGLMPVLSVSLLLAFTGCRTLPPLPAVDLSEPGWTVREGEAVWRARATAPEIAGELLLATRGDGRAFVQFTKTPFPLVIAQSTTNAWQIESPTENRRYARRGAPPARLIWLELPRALNRPPPPKKWSWTLSENNWRLENLSTGEALEGYFSR